MLKKLKRIMGCLFLSSIMVLSGCTDLLWGKRNPNGGFLAGSEDIVTKDVYVKKVAQDHLQGFVLLTDKNTNTKKIMVAGEKFGYLIHSGHSDVFALLDSSLDPQYWRIAQSGNCDCALKLKVDKVPKQKKVLSFTTRVKFIYIKPNLTVQEQHILNQLGIHSSAQQSSAPYKMIDLTGDVVGLSSEIKNLEFKKFSQNYSIEMYADQTKKHVNYSLMLTYIAMTPFAVLSDIILSPLYLFLYIKS